MPDTSQNTSRPVSESNARGIGKRRESESSPPTKFELFEPVLSKKGRRQKPRILASTQVPAMPKSPSLPPPAELLKLAGVTKKDLAHLAKKTILTATAQLDAVKLTKSGDMIPDNGARNMAVKNASSILGLGRSKTAEAIEAKKKGPQVMIVLPNWALPLRPRRMRKVEGEVVE